MTTAPFDEARRYIPGGVNSPVRAFRAVGGDPVFLEKGSGARVRDVNGKEYIDYLGSWGPLILGHCHPRVVAALRETCGEAITFGMPTEAETRLARAVVEAVPSVEKVRFVSSGTEATMSAIRLARGFTGRDLVIKVQGCYHGHVDALLVEAGSGVATLGIPGSPGVTSAVAAQTLTIPFNDLEALERACAANEGRIACMILEPVAGNMGVVPPATGYLEGVREITARHGIVFICDEVMTGFRVAWGGAQERYGFTADLVTLGKILGGGLPVAAYGGRSEIMDRLAPDGPVYQAGTLSGNPLAMRAGFETLAQVREHRGPGGATAYEQLESVCAGLEKGLAAAAREAGLPVRINRVGSMMTLFFTDSDIRDWSGAKACDTARYSRYFRGMLDRGVFLPPSQFEAFFVSLAHGSEEIERTVAAAHETLGEIAR